MYYIQELIDEDTWVDRYKNYDYDLILNFYHNFVLKYPGRKFRVLEVFIYV